MQPAGEAKRKSKVIWNDQEIAAVARAAVERSLEDRSFIWSFVSHGQSVLPHNRRRTITGRNGINARIIEEFSRLRQEILEEGVPFQVDVVRQVMVERPREDILNSITTEELIGLLAKRLAPVIDMLPGLIQKGTQRLATPPVPEAQHHPAPAEEVEGTTRYPKVLLTGFLPGQEKDIRAKAGEFKLNLVFKGKDVEKSAAPSSCQWCVSLRKMSHAMSGRLKKTMGKNIIIVDGITGALKALADINSRIQ